MKSSNGWFSVHDTEHRPQSGEEVIALGLLDSAKEEDDPFENPGDRIYYVATWYNEGDELWNESTQEETAECETPEELLRARIFGTPAPAPKDGFYIREPDLTRRLFTDGGRLAPYAILFRWHRLSYDTEGADGLICWKPLDYPTME